MTLVEEHYEYWRQRCALFELKYERCLELVLAVLEAWEQPGNADDLVQDLRPITDRIRDFLEE